MPNSSSILLWPICFSVGLVTPAVLHAADPPNRDPDTEFKKLDADGDGEVLPDEFKAFLPSRFVPDLFRRLDRDDDGLLTLNEFRTVAAIRGKGRVDDHGKLPTPRAFGGRPRLSLPKKGCSRSMRS